MAKGHGTAFAQRRPGRLGNAATPNFKKRYPMRPLQALAATMTDARRDRFEPGSRSMPKAPAWSNSADTHVLCTASLENQPPPFLKGTGQGWVTAEYGMLPRATVERTRREAAAGKQSRPHAGNPAPDRPLAARRDGRSSSWRAPDHHRLRRDPGRRRHAHGGDHRRLRRAPRCLDLHEARPA